MVIVISEVLKYIHLYKYR